MARGFRRRRRGGKRCIDDVTFDYKDVDELKKFMTDHGKILPRRKTGLCAKQQRQLATAVKRARHLAMLPYHVY